MSRHVTVNGRVLMLCRSSVQSQYWVRLAATGRTLGCVFKDRSSWCWATSRVAYRGDGRTDTATDGIGDTVPGHLDGIGKRSTQAAACACLLDHLETTVAPALGHPPHPDVLRKVPA